MRALSSVGFLTVVLSACVALGVQACEDDSGGGGFAIDASAPTFQPFEAGRPDSALPVVDAAIDATEDAAPDADAAPLPPAHFNQPYALAVDGQYLYVVDRLEGIYRVAKDGSTSQRMTISEPVWRMALDGNRLFFTTAAGEVKVVPTNAVDGGGEATLVSGESGVLPIRLDGTTLLFGIYGSGSSTTVRAADVDGGNVRTVATGLRPYDIAAAGGNLFAASSGTSNQAIRQIPLDGGAFTPRATAVGTVSDFAVSDGYVYWTTRGGTVMRVPVAGGAEETIATGEGAVAGIAVDDTNAYWVQYDAFNPNGGVRRAPKAGGQTPVTVVPNLQHAFAVAVDATHVYWATYTADGGVSRTLK